MRDESCDTTSLPPVDASVSHLPCSRDLTCCIARIGSDHPMRHRLTSSAFIVTFALSALVSSGAPAPAKGERIEASYVLAFGRMPSPAEISEAQKSSDATLAERVAEHRQRLQSDAALKRETAVKAWRDAFGREPTDGEIAGSSDNGGTYTELMKHHIKSLAGSSDEYAKVLERAYRLVIRRGVYPEEITYWKDRDTLSYALLVGCVENWGRRNAPGLMVTVGTPTVSSNSHYLTTLRLSPITATEARAAAGLNTKNGSDFLSATGRTLVAVGAEDLVASGGIHFAIAGGSNLVPTGD